MPGSQLRSTTGPKAQLRRKSCAASICAAPPGSTKKKLPVAKPRSGPVTAVSAPVSRFRHLWTWNCGC